MGGRAKQYARFIGPVVGLCWVCKGWYAMPSVSGVMRQHQAWLVTMYREPGWDAGIRCPGSGQAPKETKPGTRSAH